MVDWEQAIQNATKFDGGDRDVNASLGKILTAIQRQAFENGYAAGVNSKHPMAFLLADTAGNA